MTGNAEIGDYVRKDGSLVQVQSIDQSNQTYFTSDGGVIGFGEVGMDDVLLASEVEG